MNGKLPRYSVSRTKDGWAVIDRTKIKMHNDVVVTCTKREEARLTARRMNIQVRVEEGMGIASQEEAPQQEAAE